MILTGIINLAYLLISGILLILPAGGSFPTEAHEAMAGLGGYLGMWSPILPITVLVTCLTIVFSVEIGIFTFKSVKWIISHIPWVGGKG